LAFRVHSIMLQQTVRSCFSASVNAVAIQGLVRRLRLCTDAMRTARLWGVAHRDSAASVVRATPGTACASAPNPFLLEGRSVEARRRGRAGERPMGVTGFIIGSVGGMFSGAWVYWQVRGDSPGAARREARAAAAAGLVTAVIDTVIFIPLGVHTWVGGDGTPWGMSVFLGLCMGMCQGMLFRGKPLRPRRPKFTGSQ